MNKPQFLPNRSAKEIADAVATGLRESEKKEPIQQLEEWITQEIANEQVGGYPDSSHNRGQIAAYVRTRRQLRKFRIEAGKHEQPTTS